MASSPRVTAAMSNNGRIPLGPSPTRQHLPNTSTTTSQPRKAGSAQEMAYNQNGQLPVADMSVLSGISPEQLAAIARLLQSGALPIPQSTPKTASPNVVDDTSELQNGKHELRNSTDMNGLSSNDETPGLRTNLEREEGELEEGELGDSEIQTAPLSSLTTSLHKQVDGSRVASDHGKPPIDPRYSRTDIHKSSTLRKPATPPQRAHYSGAIKKQPRPASKAEAARAFVSEMLKAGYTLEQLAPEVSSPESCEDLIVSLPCCPAP